MKRMLLLLIILFFSAQLFSNDDNNNDEKKKALTTTTITDPNFEQALIDLGYDTGVPDGSVPTANISGITNLNISNPLTNPNLPSVNAKITDLTGIEDFAALERLSLNDNMVSILDVSQNTALIELNCSNNQLTALDVSANPVLKTLFCETNQIGGTINTSSNPVLEFFACSFNQITSLDVSSNPLLQNLAAGNNQLPALDVSSNPLLTSLSCDNNSLTALNVGVNTALTFLGVQNNQITSLDVSANSSLNELWVGFNQLTSLNIANGNNATLFSFGRIVSLGLSVFNSTGNPALSCIIADASTPINGLTGWVKDNQHLFSANCAQTYVPDNNLEAYLETHDANGNVVPLADPTSMGNGIANDDYVLTNRINTVTKLEVPNLSITLMTGIEDFAALERLSLNDNNVSVLDVSQNTTLIELNCSSNQLTALDISANPVLKTLFCENNQIAGTINTSSNPVLEFFACSFNQITSLNVSSNPLLQNLAAGNNQLPALDVSSNPLLTNLSCDNNSLTTLNVGVNTALTFLGIQNNQITALDVSTNSLLTQLYCSFNQLTTLNIANGNNTGLSVFNSIGNSSLTCITADSATPTTGFTGWNKDAQHTFSVACSSQQLTYVPDNNLELYLETHDRDGNVVPLNDPTSMGNGIANDDYVYTNRINTVIVLRVNGLTISDMTGIEDFTALQVLDAHDNNIASIDVSALSDLYQLAIGSNPFNMIDVSSNSNLRILEVNNTSLTSLDVTSNAVLEFLKIDDNSFTSIDTSQNPNLKTLSTENTPLTQVDLTNNTLLEFLELRDNALTGLDISNNLQLISFVLTGSPVTSLDLSQHDKLIEVRLNNNTSLTQLNIKNGTNTNISTSSFDITNNPALTCIEVDSVTYSDTNWTSKDMQHVYNTTCSSQQITLIPDPLFEQILINFNIDSDGVVNGQVFTADIQYVATLYLYCNYNCSSVPTISDLTGIEDFTSLHTLEAANNSITGSLDLSNNTNLTRVRVQNNLITNLILGNNSNLKEIRAQGNNISAIDVSGNVNLEEINLDSNSLSTINLTQNTNLTKLYLNNNMLTTLDITNNNLLGFLHIDNNQITNINLTNNTDLYTFRAQGNLLFGQIDFSNNSKLTNVFLTNNQLSVVDLSASIGIRLMNIMVADNNLHTLNLDNGLTSSSGPSGFDTRNNADLKCIQVPDVSMYQWATDIDPHTSFNTDCSSVWTVMTNPATTTALLAIPGLDDGDGEITIAEAAAYTGTLDLSGTGITDVEGLQAFTSITTLDVSGNGITDLSPLTNSFFTTIAKSTGKTKTIAKTTTMALEKIVLSNNNFDVIDVSSLTNLKEVDLSNNPDLITVNLKNGNNANITTFSSANTPNLSCILVDDPNASYLSTWTKDAKNTFVADEAQCRAEVLSIDNFDVTNNVTLYPNPVTDFLQIELKNQLEIKNIQVYTIIGKLVHETKTLAVDFTNMTKGIYLLKILTNKGVATKKIVKN